jgi:hypothetical protein
VQRFPIRLTDRPSGPGLFANPTWLVIGDLVAVRWLIGLGAEEGRGVVTSPDVTRFHQIANSERGPYRDFEVEYTPVERIAIELVANGERRTALDGRSSRGGGALCDPLAFGGIWYGWGWPPGLACRGAVWGLALGRRGRERTGGATLALAAMTKLWPLVVAPVFVTERRGRATRWFVGPVSGRSDDLGRVRRDRWGPADALVPGRDGLGGLEHDRVDRVARHGWTGSA